MLHGSAKERIRTWRSNVVMTSAKTHEIIASSESELRTKLEERCSHPHPHLYSHPYPNSNVKEMLHKERKAFDAECTSFNKAFEEQRVAFQQTVAAERPSRRL